MSEVKNWDDILDTIKTAYTNWRINNECVDFDRSYRMELITSDSSSDTRVLFKISNIEIDGENLIGNFCVDMIVNQSIYDFEDIDQLKEVTEDLSLMLEMVKNQDKIRVKIPSNCKKILNELEVDRLIKRRYDYIQLQTADEFVEVNQEDFDWLEKYNLIIPIEDSDLWRKNT